MRLSIFITGLLCAATGMLAQDLRPMPGTPRNITDTRTPTAHAPLFPTASYFKKVFQPVTTKVELKPPVRLADFIVDDKLELSLRSYLDAVLANNTDIAIQRLSVETARNAVLRSHSIFDPGVVASFNSTRTLQPANDVLAGAANLNSLNQPFRFNYQQMLPTGTLYNVGFNTTKTSNNSQFTLFNPAFNSNLNFNFSQPLMRNRGMFLTKLPVTIARSRLRQNEFNIQDQVLRLVTLAENAYWAVISERENLRVQEQNLALVDQFLKRSQRELELGSISVLDIYQPQAQYAQAEISVTQARYRLQLAEDALRRQMGADLDPYLRNLPIVLTESIEPPTDLSLDREALVETALQVRPDLKAARQNLDIDELQIRGAENGLKPDLRLTGQYGSFGRGGPFTQRTNVFEGDGGRSTIINTIPGGFSDALDQLFGFNFPQYGFGLTLTLPLRDRRASADYADALVNKRLDALRIRTVEQNVRQDVLNAITQVESSRASVELAKVALDLAQKRADAEQKKFDLGTTTIFFVLDAQNALSRAQSDLVNQTVNFRRNLTNLLRVTGGLLAERGIAIE